MKAASDVLVLGGGPAGMAAVAELARLGLGATLVEQRPQLGGAIYRAYAGAGINPHPLLRHHRRWRDGLFRGVAEAESRVRLMTSSVFLGIDGDGRFLVDQREHGRVVGLRPKAVIMALGTVEQVRPVDGWELPGVVTAGGMQVQLKETGEPPRGSILLAGNGPLLLALGAQLAMAGNPPVAILERAQPLGAALELGLSARDALGNPVFLQEAFGYGFRLLRSRVPYRTGWTLVSIQPGSNGLLVDARHVSGRLQHYQVSQVALHDGLAGNNTGLKERSDPKWGIVRAGDLREVLGAQAAVLDGRRAARMVAHQCGLAIHDQSFDQALHHIRRSQQAMAQLFLVPPLKLANDPVICRCEGLRQSAFDAMTVAGSPRELRLVGRFGMGACQGRFCARAVSELAREKKIEFKPSELQGDVQRWPLRPVSVAALANYADVEETL